MNYDKTIKNLLVRVVKLENVVFNKQSDTPKKVKNQDFKGATGGIRFLISKGFFSKKRSFGEIRKALSENSYHYSAQAVQTPLNKLSRTGGFLVALKEDGKKIYAERK